MTGFLLDTNVISEMRKKQPNPSVLRFVSIARDRTLYLSCLSFGELRRGAELKRKTDAIAADSLDRWIEGLESQYDNRTLGIDATAAKLWGGWSAQRSRSIVDTLMAATAAVHQLTFVTRNVADVHDLPVQILNPWEER